MGSAEQFMAEYLVESAAVARKGLECFAPFRRRFYTDNCPFGSRRMERLEKLCMTGEKLTGISHRGGGAVAFTTKTGPSGNSVNLRYRLLAGDRWLIQDIEAQCPT